MKDDGGRSGDDLQLALRFVVVGTGRCGTSYIARVLTMAGVPCGHEQVFTPHGVRPAADAVGDASWMAVPHLDRFRGLVLHQVRRPMDVVRSLVGIRLFTDPRHGAYRAFALDHVTVDLGESEVTTAARFCIEWNRRCERRADLWYRVEDIDAVLPEISSALDVDPRRLADAAATTDRRLNHRVRSAVTIDHVQPAALRAQLIDMCERYGYPAE